MTCTATAQTDQFLRRDETAAKIADFFHFTLIMVPGKKIAHMQMMHDTIYGDRRVRTLTVKETAKVLGVSVRTVQNRLATEELKGKRVLNQYGVSEWRVWPNKEITEKAQLIGLLDELGEPSEEFQGGDASAVLDAETMDVDNTYFEETQAPLTTVVREMAQQFAEQLSKEKETISILHRELEDKDRQLKLLPDFQKQAEDRRREAEAKELEAIALAKQIEALKAKSEEAAASVARLTELETEILPTLERQLEQERVQKEKELTEAQNRLSALETDKQEAEAAKAKLEESLQKEIDRLKEEKEEQAKLIQTQFETLNQKLERLQKPQKSWLQKMFSSPES
jgi:hypothetical protein